MNEHDLDLNPAAGSAGERHRRAYVLIHAIVWSMFILFPFLLIDRTGDVRDWAEFLRRLWIVIPFMLVFYANYAWLIPACLFRRQKAGRFILAQFLIEAVLISITGGIIGVLAGCAASWAVKAVAQWPVYIQPWSVVLSFAVCTVTGIFFGWYPARKAANLDPIEALRYE